MLLPPLPKGRGPSFEPIYIILTQRDFKSSLDDKWPSGSGKEF